MVFVTDEAGTEVLQSETGNANQSVGGVNGISDNEIFTSSASYFLTANGTDDVTIRFQATGADTELPLNGILLYQVVPEPSTALLALFGGLGLWMRRRVRS